MTTPTKIRLQGTNVMACVLPPIEILEARYKFADDHEGIVARDFKLIPGKTRRGTAEGAPVGSYTNGSLRQQVEVTWMDGDTKHKIRVQKARIVYRMAHGPFDESLVIDHIDGNPNNNHPSNLRPLTYHANMGNRVAGLQASPDAQEGCPPACGCDPRQALHLKGAIHREDYHPWSPS